MLLCLSQDSKTAPLSAQEKHYGGEFDQLEELLGGVFVLANIIILGDFILLCQRYDYSRFNSSATKGNIASSAELGHLPTQHTESKDAPSNIEMATKAPQQAITDESVPSCHKPLYTTAIFSFIIGSLALMATIWVFFSTNKVTRSDYLVGSMLFVDPCVVAAVLLRAWIAGELKEVRLFVWSR